MFAVGMYVQVRRAGLVEGMNVREASRVFGLHRDTVRKMLAYSALSAGRPATASQPFDKLRMSPSPG